MARKTTAVFISLLMIWNFLLGRTDGVVLCLHKSGFFHLIEGPEHEIEHGWFPSESGWSNTESDEEYGFLTNQIDCPECIDVRLKGGDLPAFIPGNTGVSLPGPGLFALGVVDAPYPLVAFRKVLSFSRPLPLFANLSLLHTKTVVLHL